MEVSKNSNYQTRKEFRKTFEKPKRPNWRAKRGILRIFKHPLLQNTKKLKGRTFRILKHPLLQNTKKLKGGTFRIFKHPLLQNIKKLKWGPFGEKNIPEKVSQHRKN